VLGRVNVGTPDDEVRADWQRRAKKLPPCLAKKVVAFAVKAHHENIDEYNDVMRGTVGRRRRRRK
jgi:hypothetical protein